MTVLATFRVTNDRSRTTSVTMQIVRLTIISMVIAGSYANAQNAFANTNESDSASSVATSRALSSASSSPWTQLFSGFSLSTIFGGQHQQNHHLEADGPGESEGFVSRTFGFNRLKKKIALGLLPVMFKVGIMVMVIFAILLLSLKGVFLGTLLLIINLGFILAKLLAWKTHGHGDHGGYIEKSAWPAGYGGGKQNNDIHVHIHNPAPAPAPQYTHHDLPYSGYAPQNHGPSIHIEPAAYNTIGNSDSWSGYQRRQSPQYGQEYVDASGSDRGNYRAPANAQYVPTNQWS